MLDFLYFFFFNCLIFYVRAKNLTNQRGFPNNLFTPALIVSLLANIRHGQNHKHQHYYAAMSTPLFLQIAYRPPGPPQQLALHRRQCWESPCQFNQKIFFHSMKVIKYSDFCIWAGQGLTVITKLLYFLPLEW